MKRQSKTPKQRAEEALGVAERAVARLTSKVASLRAELVELEAEHSTAVTRRNYLANHPDLNPADVPLPLGDES